MKTVFISILATVLGFWSQVAQASCLTQCRPVITVTADKYPGEVYKLGVDADKTGNLKQVYFENEKGQKNFFSLKEAQNGVVLIQTRAQESQSSSKEKTYDLVLLEVSHMPAGKIANVTFSYLFNGITHSYISENVQLAYSKETNCYKLYDKTGKEITTANVVTRTKKIFKKSIDIGIETIEFN